VIAWGPCIDCVGRHLLLAVANIGKILHVFGTRGIFAGFLLIALGFGMGWMLGDLAVIRDGHWPSVPGSVTSPRHSWLRAKASVIQAWSSW